MNFIIAVVIMITAMFFCQWLFAKVLKGGETDAERAYRQRTYE